MANYPDDWDNLRRYIYERDDYTCQKCGVIDVELHAHHINGRSHHPSNLVTLCRNCHADIHPHLEREHYYEPQTIAEKIAVGIIEIMVIVGRNFLDIVRVIFALYLIYIFINILTI